MSSSEECDRFLHESSPNMLTFEATLFHSSSVSFLHVQNIFYVFHEHCNVGRTNKLQEHYDVNKSHNSAIEEASTSGCGNDHDHPIKAALACSIFMFRCCKRFAERWCIESSL